EGDGEKRCQGREAHRTSGARRIAAARLAASRGCVPMPRPAAQATPSASDPAFASSAEMILALQPTEPVYCVYAEVLRELAQGFLRAFPGRVLYAVKANPEPRILSQLWAAGVRCFDTASLGEMRTVHSVAPEATCYFMAPVKFPGAMREAFAAHGVRHCVI